MRPEPLADGYTRPALYKSLPDGQETCLPLSLLHSPSAVHCYQMPPRSLEELRALKAVPDNIEEYHDELLKLNDGNVFTTLHQSLWAYWVALEAAQYPASC